MDLKMDGPPANASLSPSGNASDSKASSASLGTVCPGDWRRNENFSHPKACASDKRQTNCSWDDVHGGGACNSSCFCGDAYMDLATCANVCKKDTCVFTYTSQGGCLVYESCSSSQPADSYEEGTSDDWPSEFGLSDDWATCERFFGVYYDKVISLHNDFYNAYMILGADGTVTRTNFEIGLSEISRITASMHWIVAGTEGLMDRVAARMGLESGDNPPSQAAEMQFSGGPGIIALYNNNNDDGSMWLSMDADGLIVNDGELSDRAMFTVCYIGPTTVALHNKVSNRYVMMDNSRLSSSAPHDCCSVPEGTSWKGTHFTIVLPTKVPTGTETDATNIEDDDLR